MNRTILSGLMAAGLLVLISGPASAGSLRDCVVEKGAMDLSDGQMALLMALGDGELNVLSTAKDHELMPSDAVAVHVHMWRAGLKCLQEG